MKRVQRSSLMSIYTLPLLIILLISSCYPKLSYTDHHDIALSKSDPKLIEGRFSNKTVFKPHYTYSLYSELFNCRKTKAKRVAADSNATIELKLIDEKHLLVTLYDSIQQLDQFTLKGKFKENSFVIKQRTKVIPFPPFYFSYDITKTNLCLDKDLNLVSQTSHSYFLWIFIASGGSGITGVNIYERVR